MLTFFLMFLRVLYYLVAELLVYDWVGFLLFGVLDQRKRKYN
jgi:hypothetical protein